MIDNNFLKSDLDLAEELGVDILNIEYPKDDYPILDKSKEVACWAPFRPDEYPRYD